MNVLQRKFVAIIFVTVYINTASAGIPQSASSCINDDQKSLSFGCGHGYLLRVTRAFYGSTTSNMCVYQPGDCKEDEYKPYPCTGKETCRINLPSGGLGRNLKSCNKTSSYFQVNYECIPVQETHAICNGTKIQGQRGYIKSPNYPNNYQESTHCTLKLLVEPYQKIELYILDVDLEKDETGCQDYILVKDSLQTTTLCGRRWNERIRVEWKDLTVTFHSNAKQNYKGFLIYYEASPGLTTTTPTTTKPPTTIKSPNGDSTGIHEDKDNGIIQVTNKEHNMNLNTKTDKLPFAAIVGGVIGTLSFILIILLVLLVVKWAREKKRRRDKNLFIEVQNPGYRNSNEFQQNRNSNILRQDMCYNYMDV